MFPDGNIIVEMSKFGENVPAWELLAARVGLLNKIVPEREYCLPNERLLEPNARAREHTAGPISAQRPYFESTFIC